MDYRELGRTGLEVSRIGLGCGNFGGVGSAPELFGQGETEEEAFALMDAAWAAGITFFDTAASYGGGRSERWVGRWRRERGVPVLLSSKVYWSVTGDPEDRGLSGDRVLREVEGSLERLGVERLDLYLTHEPDPETPIEETLRALDEARPRREGARDWGEQPRRGAARGGPRDERAARSRALRLGAERVQPASNKRRMAFSRSASARASGLRRSARLPAAGSPASTGAASGYPAGSRMTLRPGPYEALARDETFDALEAFEAAAARRGVEPAMLAIAWVLSDPRVTALVVGPRNPKQLDSALEGLVLRLSPAERDELAELFP